MDFRRNLRAVDLKIRRMLSGNQKKRTVWFGWLALGILIFGFQTIDATVWKTAPSDGSTTVLFYMNGDNDLTDEVLSAVDAMETVGSTAKLNIVALVDGHPGGISRFGSEWIETRLLHITPDDQIAQINSTVLSDWGERDLGDPDTLTRFIRVALDLFPAERYIFCTFAHGKGVIDTGRLTIESNQKTLSISPDATSQTIMPLTAFEHALKNGLNGRRFSLMILFSCLSSMVEIAYALNDVTDYLIASEDEIHLVNEPPGTHQLRGISFEGLLQDLKKNPVISEIELGRHIINRFVEPYNRDVYTLSAGGSKKLSRYPAGLSLIDCCATVHLAAALDELAGELIDQLNQPNTAVQTLADLQVTLKKTPSFKSFLNLEYYDLLNFLAHMVRTTSDSNIRDRSLMCIKLLKSKVIKFERHTSDVKSNGLAIFFSHYLVPGNVFTAHSSMYRRTRFSRQTRWDELIQTYRTQLQLRQSDLLLHQCRVAYRDRDMKRVRQLSRKAVRILSQQLKEGRVEDTREYIAFLSTLPLNFLSAPLIEDLENLIGDDVDSHQFIGLSHQIQRLIQR